MSKEGREHWNKKNGIDFGRIKYASKRVVDEMTGFSRQYVTIRRVLVKKELKYKKRKRQFLGLREISIIREYALLSRPQRFSISIRNYGYPWENMGFA